MKPRPRGTPLSAITPWGVINPVTWTRQGTIILPALVWRYWLRFWFRLKWLKDLRIVLPNEQIGVLGDEA